MLNAVNGDIIINLAAEHRDDVTPKSLYYNPSLFLKLFYKVKKFLFCKGCLLVGVVALLPNEYFRSSVFNIWDKAQHVVVFALLALLGFISYPHRFKMIFLFLLIYGGAIEAAQFVTGWRECDWMDWLADIMGVVTAYTLWRRKSI